MENLTTKEQEIVLNCLKACMDETFFPDWEFHTLTGAEKAEVQEIIDMWPKADFNTGYTKPLVLNVLNNLLGYPHGVTDEAWDTAIGAEPKELDKLWEKINGMTENDAGSGSKFFRRMQLR